MSDEQQYTILMIVKIVKNSTGKYAKRTLQQIERSGMLTKELRKIILDNYNDLARETLKQLGYEEEE